MLGELERLSADARRLIESSDQELWLSAASAWEIAIKWSMGKLVLPVGPELFVPDRLQRTGVMALPVTHTHALRAGVLPPHHRDPFDRALNAQAELEGYSILTTVARFETYDVAIIRAA